MPTYRASVFGTQLRQIRKRCVDPDIPGRNLSQERLGELLGGKLEIRGGYSGAAVSDWERGKSKIHADDRLVLTSLLAVLYEQSGIKTVTEANQLLASGNYRSLDPSEVKQVFPPGLELPLSDSERKNQHNIVALLLGEVFFIPEEELRIALLKAKVGPSPAWPRMFAAMLRAVQVHRNRKKIEV